MDLKISLTQEEIDAFCATNNGASEEEGFNKEDYIKSKLDSFLRGAYKQERIREVEKIAREEIVEVIKQEDLLKSSIAEVKI